MKNALLVGTFMFGVSAATAFSAGPQDTVRIQELKSRIIAIASENQNNLNNFADVRKELDPLVSELSSLQELSPDESLSRKLGSWRQLWTDDSDDTKANNLFVQVDREQTYQVVLNNGVFYNVSVVHLPFGIDFSAFLKGAYQPEGEKLGIEFKSLKLRLGGVSNVTTTVDKVERNSLLGVVPFPGGGRKPNGPVGVKGEIKTVYIDEELRVDYGSNLDDGVQDLFILQRESSK